MTKTYRSRGKIGVFSRLALVGLLPVICLGLLATPLQATQKPTLGQLREKYLGQKLVVKDVLLTEGGSLGGRLLNWALAERKAEGRYETKSGYRHLLAEYNGREGSVIAVQLNSLKLRDQRTNALGEVSVVSGNGTRASLWVSYS